MRLQSFSTSEQPGLNVFQKRWIIVSSSLVLALIQAAFVILPIVYRIFGPQLFFTQSVILVLILLSLIYFIIPFQVSLYMTYRTKNHDIGTDAGRKIGCAGALLSILFIILAGEVGMGVGFITGYQKHHLKIFAIIIVASNLILILIAMLGALSGSRVGNMLNKRKTSGRNRM